MLRNVKVDYNMGETLEAEDEESTPVKEARMWERPNDKSGDSSVEDDQVGSLYVFFFLCLRFIYSRVVQQTKK